MLIDCSDIQLDRMSPKTDFEMEVFEFLKETLSDKTKTTVKTSGSTGIPKLFEVEKARMFASAKMTCDFLRLKKGDSAALCMPVEYISGKMMLIRAIERGLKLQVFTPKTEALSQLNLPIDFCALTPLQVENSLTKLKLIKNLIIGGAGVSESLKKKICQHLDNEKHTIYETYGMSETLSHIALKKIYPISEDYFTSFENVEISTDTRGCLQIFSPQINSELLITNDLVEIINDKQFRFLGRIDNVINSGGAKIFPEKIETFLKKEVSAELIVTSIKDEHLGEKMILVIEGQDDDKLRNSIFNLSFERKLDRPKQIVFIDKMPRTPNGKVSRLDLKKQLKELL